ncbi:MAG: Foldase protein PrsA 2 [Pseudomonadota bacterium]|jgi:parvulin-like peptidyl-prolyl isomerase
MKKLASLALVTLLTFATSVEADTPAQAKPANPQLSDSTVLAVVGQHSITVDELNQQLNRPDLKATVDALKEQPAELAKLRESVLTSMIDKELLLKAAQSSPSYKPSEVQKEVDTIIQEQGGRAVVEPILKSYGTSWEAFVSDMNDRMAIERFIERDLLANLTVSDEQLKAAFTANPNLYAEPETVSARHILVLVKSDASPAEQQKALERIKGIKERALAPGADFGKIAAETSDDTASKIDGGNLGTFQRGMMVPEFEKAAFALKVGEISEPVKTQYGYHLIKVETHQESQAPTFEKAKDKVRYQVMAGVHDKALQEKLAQLRSATKVELKTTRTGHS